MRKTLLSLAVAVGMGLPMIADLVNSSSANADEELERYAARTAEVGVGEIMGPTKCPKSINLHPDFDKIGLRYIMLSTTNFGDGRSFYIGFDTKGDRIPNIAYNYDMSSWGKEEGINILAKSSGEIIIDSSYPPKTIGVNLDGDAFNDNNTYVLAEDGCYVPLSESSH